jgi:hypothetical protein
MKDKNHMITSIDAQKKLLKKTSTFPHDKSSEETSKRSNIPQRNKDYS